MSLAELALPVAGLLSDAPLDEVVAGSRAVTEAARTLGCELESPFQHLAFLALSVIPSLKLTDRGLVDVDRFELVPLELVILGNAWIVTCDDAGTEHEHGWLRIEDGLVAEIGAGAAPDGAEDLDGAVVTPGPRQHPPSPVPDADARASAAGRPLHLAEDAVSDLGAHRRRDAVRGGADRPRRAGAVGLHDGLRPPLRLPAGVSGLIDAELHAADELGVRIVASRGSMDLGESDGGLPPDSLVETIDEILADTERLAALADGDLVGIAVAPCSPFSVTTRLMEESAALARRLGLQLHTHLAETLEEDAYCRELFGCSPVEYLERVGWIADDVWCAHCVHLSDADVQTFGERGVGVAHCPTSNLRLGAGVAPVRQLLDAGVRVGLGVDGTASNERSDLFAEVKQALLVARGRGGGEAMTARDALRLGTRGGASVLRRDDIGSLEPGKRADVAVWRTDGLEFGGAEDLVANLVLSGPHRVDRLLVGGEDVVRGGSLVHADEQEIAREHRIQARRLWQAVTVSTHVLDTERGRPAAGVRVELYDADGPLAGEGVTDGDGRIATLGRRASRDRTASSSIRRRRSSRGSSSRSRSATATSTFRC